MFVVLLVNPLALTSSGFWLSFIAVAALLAFAGSFEARVSVKQIETPAGERLKGAARLFVRPQLIVFIALGVPLVFLTQQLSLLAPQINIVAIPVVGFLIVPICFASLLVSFVHERSAMQLFTIADGAIALLIDFMEFLVGLGAVLISGRWRSLTIGMCWLCSSLFYYCCCLREYAEEVSSFH